MTKRKLKPFVVPMMYAVSVIVFVIGMYFIERLVSNTSLFKKEENLEYVDSEIVEKNDYLPVINTTVTIIRPYQNNEVYIAKNFYDYEKDASWSIESLRGCKRS